MIIVVIIHDYDGEDDDDDLIEDNEEDDDEDDDVLFNTNRFLNGVSYFKQAQPVHKKYASTGFLFNRYLAPIEESLEETVNTQQNFNENEFSDNRNNYNKYESSIADDNVLNKTKYLNSSNLDQNTSLKGSTSCFDLTSVGPNSTYLQENNIKSNSKSNSNYLAILLTY